MEIRKGEQVTIAVAFKDKSTGLAANFVNPPTWTLYNEDDKVIQTGTALAAGSKWTATFTIPTNYVVDEGSEDLEIEFYGTDAKKRSYSRAKAITLLDEHEGFKPLGLVYSLLTPEPLIDTIILPKPAVDSIQATIFTPFDSPKFIMPTITNPTHIQKTSEGYLFEVTLDINDELATSVAYNDPMLLSITAKMTGVGKAHNEIHPVYVLNAKLARLANSMEQFLNKAQLREIDPSLQWHLSEYLHYLQEGMKHINSIGEPSTFWNLNAYPSSMQQYLLYAALLHALNARYLAEGFNAFQFNGLNTTLDFDRREAITYKIEEMKEFLQNLPAAKAAAVNSFGVGTPPADSGETAGAAANSSVLGVQISPVTNYPFGRFYRRPFIR